MHILPVIALVALTRLAAASSDDPLPPELKFLHQDECGNPMKESQVWMEVEGTVEEVLTVRTFRLRRTDGKVIKVANANVQDSMDLDGLYRVHRLLDGQHVSVLVDPSHTRRTSIVGNVHTERGDSVSTDLLKSGLAAFVPEKVYLSAYEVCLHRIYEREAKAQHLGIWKEMSTTSTQQ